MQRLIGHPQESYVMEMHCLKERTIRQLVAEANARLRMCVLPTLLIRHSMETCNIWTMASSGIRQQQYCVVKNP